MVRRMKRLKPAPTSAFVPAFARRRMSRRDFLKVTGVGLAGTSFLGVAGCTGGGGGENAGEFTLTFGPDDQVTCRTPSISSTRSTPASTRPTTARCPLTRVSTSTSFRPSFRSGRPRST